MEIYAITIAALLYLCSAVAPASRRQVIGAATAIAWLAHGMALWGDMLAPHALRMGFAMMLSAAMWLSVAVYWLENRTYAPDLPTLLSANLIDPSLPTLHCSPLCE